MTTTFRMTAVLCAVTLLATAAATAQDADTQEVQKYALTESGLAKFKQATRALIALDAACEADEDDDSNSESIDAMVAELDATPGARAAIQSGGMSTREYVVFSWSIAQSGMAAWALKQPGGKLPPGISQANVDFYNKHEAGLAALGDENRCGEGDSGDEPTE